MIPLLLDVTSFAFYCAGGNITIQHAENVFLRGGDSSMDTMNVGRG